MAKKRISVRSAKNKGMNLQKWTCKKISEVTGIPFDNQDDNCLIHSRECGLSGVDVILRGEALKKFPFAPECKSSEQWNLPKAIEQAKSNTKEGVDWLLVLKRKQFKAPVVVLDANVFFKLIEENLYDYFGS